MRIELSGVFYRCEMCPKSEYQAQGDLSFELQGVGVFGIAHGQLVTLIEQHDAQTCLDLVHARLTDERGARHTEGSLFLTPDDFLKNRLLGETTLSIAQRTICVEVNLHPNWIRHQNQTGAVRISPETHVMGNQGVYPKQQRRR